MTTISIRIEEDEKELIQQYAKDHDLTVSQVIRRAVRDFLATKEDSAAD